MYFKRTLLLHNRSFQLHINNDIMLLISSISDQVNSYVLKDYTGIYQYQNWKRLSSEQKAMVVEMVINKAKADLKESDIKSIKSLLESKDIDKDKLMAIIIEVINGVRHG